MKLQEYTFLKDKNHYFQTGDSKIDDIKSFNYIYNHFKQQSDETLYRGVNEAKYMLYNSAQRHYLQNDIFAKGINYKDFILNIIHECKTWNNGAIASLCKTILIDEDNYLAYLSLLQHSGKPSPCLDFSSSPLTSLFFAFYNSQIDGTEEIDNYVSLYMINKSSKWFFIKLHNTMLNALKMRNTFKNENNKVSVNNHIPFEVLFSLGDEIMLEITDENSYKTINNFKILNQSGKLIFSTSSNTSVEVLSKKRIEKVDRVYSEIKCLNFNKSLQKYVLKRLNEDGINEKTIFNNTDLNYR